MIILLINVLYQEASRYHVFIDDGHSYDREIQANSVEVELLFTNAKRCLMIYDRPQQGDLSSSFLVQSGQQQRTLDLILRNAKEICDAALERRDAMG